MQDARYKMQDGARSAQMSAGVAPAFCPPPSSGARGNYASVVAAWKTILGIKDRAAGFLDRIHSAQRAELAHCREALAIKNEQVRRCMESCERHAGNMGTLLQRAAGISIPSPGITEPI